MIPKRYLLFQGLLMLHGALIMWKKDTITTDSVSFWGSGLSWGFFVDVKISDVEATLKAIF